MLKNLKPLVAAAAAALSLNTHAAVDMYLKLEGIDGESVSDAHKGEIDVLAWSWGMSQSGTTHLGGGGGAGKASFQDISITKWIDKSSVPLMERVATGGHIPEATLTVEKAGGNTPFEFERLVMYDVLTTSVSNGGSGGEDRLTENITLNFEAFCITYTEQRDDGLPGPESQLCFNIVANDFCSVAQVNALFSLPLVMSLPRHIRDELNPVCSNT